jgi:hypothetical protein
MTKKLYKYTSAHPPLAVSASFRRFIAETADNCLVSALILRGCIKTGRYVNREKLNKPVMNYISYRDEKGLISFMPPNREQKYNNNGSWSMEGRQTIKPARFVKNILHPRIVKKLKDHQFAEFSSKFKADELAKHVTFSVESIKFGYNAEFPLGIGSCMHKKPVHSFYEMFDCNVLVAKKDGMNIGRAILWNDVTINGKEHCKFLDRIYANSDNIVRLYEDWASDNGVYRKLRQNGDNNESLVDPEGNTIDNPIIFTYKKNTAKQKIFKPYLDTLEYTDYSYNIVSNYPRINNKAVYWHLKSAEDYREKQSYLIQAINNGRMDICDKRQCIYFKNKYYYRWDENIVECQDDCKRYHKDDKRLMKYNQRYFLKSKRVIINNHLYHKNDSRIMKTRNHRWILKPVEIVKTEDVKPDIKNNIFDIFMKWSEMIIPSANIFNIRDIRADNS